MTEVTQISPVTPMTTAPVTLRLVDGGTLTRNSGNSAARKEAARPMWNSVFRWMDWMPMTLLGLSAGLAGILQIAHVVTH